MNKARRKELAELAAKLEELKSELECIRDEEQNAFDNLPEPIQYSERGEIWKPMFKRWMTKSKRLTTSFLIFLIYDTHDTNIRRQG